MDVSEGQSVNLNSTPTTGSTPKSRRLHYKQSTPCSSNKSFSTTTPTHELNKDCLEDNCAIVLHEPSASAQYKSKLAGLISKVLGESAELALFDKFHVQLKSKSAGKVVYKQYKGIEATFQTRVLSKKSAVTEEIRVYEKEFYKMHNSLPTLDDSSYC